VSRVAVVDRTRLRVVDLDNRNAVDVTAGGDTRLANRQPAWSPDGARLAWSAFDRRQSDSPASLAVATPEGTWRVDHTTVFPPFYLAWRPDGHAIATLVSAGTGVPTSANAR
jgi:Tol biopolymer transport system component